MPIRNEALVESAQPAESVRFAEWHRWSLLTLLSHLINPVEVEKSSTVSCFH